jgi:hypothetical protein
MLFILAPTLDVLSTICVAALGRFPVSQQLRWKGIPTNAPMIEELLIKSPPEIFVDRARESGFTLVTLVKA